MTHLKLDDLIDGVEDSNIIPFKHLTFSGGEEHIQISEAYCPAEIYREGLEVLIEVSLTDSAKVMKALIATDALKRLGFKYISLFAPYLPYARQDRVCNPGEALSIKVICDLINSQNYSTVYTLDNHSDVSSALLNNHRELSVEDILRRSVKGLSEYALVSPDAGALKKTFKLAKALDGLQVIECSKKRDVRNGDIIGTEIHELKSKIKILNKFLIVDDICDGGRTFTELAKEFKLWNPDCELDLYVSHGIFSKGFGVFDGLISSIYSTNSFMKLGIEKIMNHGLIHRERFNVNDL